MQPYLASLPEVEGVTGQFFANCKPKTANQVAYYKRCDGQALAGERGPGRPVIGDLINPGIGVDLRND
jgi:hypothetical protein